MPEPRVIPETAYLAVVITVTVIMLPARPPLVLPFNVITSLEAPEMKVLPVALVTPVYKPPTILSVPSVLMSRSVAAV